VVDAPDDGVVGDAGIVGLVGDAGIVGLVGDAGIVGLVGDAGIVGLVGDAGIVGLVGDAGVVGELGVGAVGEDGTTSPLLHVIPVKGSGSGAGPGALGHASSPQAVLLQPKADGPQLRPWQETPDCPELVQQLPPTQDKLSAPFDLQEPPLQSALVMAEN